MGTKRYVVGIIRKSTKLAASTVTSNHDNEDPRTTKTTMDASQAELVGAMPVFDNNGRVDRPRLSTEISFADLSAQSALKRRERELDSMLHELKLDLAKK